MLGTRPGSVSTLKAGSLARSIASISAQRSSERCGKTDAQHADRLAEHEAMLHAVDVGAMGMDAVAEDDAGALAIEIAIGIAGIGERLRRRTHGEELVRFRTRQRHRHRAEGARIEPRRDRPGTRRAGCRCCWLSGVQSGSKIAGSPIQFSGASRIASTFARMFDQ